MLYTSYENAGLLKVLQFLKSHQMEYLSGEDLSEVLKISRVAIWKHIKKIQKLGYKIESRQNLGYRLVDTTDLLLPWEITEGLGTEYMGKKIYYHDTVDSTQGFAAKLAVGKSEAGTVVIAESQTAGKGRLGRRWVSPKGGIWLSVILHPKFDVSKITLVPFATAVALADAIEKTLGIRTELKWPNDVMLNGKKVAGIIIDASIESSSIDSLILGVGINYSIDPSEVEKKIGQNQGIYHVATLLKKDNEQKPAKLVRAFLQELEKTLKVLEGGRTQTIITRWAKKSSTIGATVSVATQDGRVSGNAVKIDKDGSLIIRRGSETVKISAGDVIHG